MKMISVILCTILISGCIPTTQQNYFEIRQLCILRKGTYFTVMVPTFLGPRMAAGCLEDDKSMQWKYAK